MESALRPQNQWNKVDPGLVRGENPGLGVRQKDRKWSDLSLQTAGQIHKQISSSVSLEKPSGGFVNAQFISQIGHGIGALSISPSLSEGTLGLWRMI